MNEQQFTNWLDALRSVWETKKPGDIVNLCADTFLWYETPFHDPITTKKALLKDWESILQQENIAFSYDILSVNSTFGIAEWEADFTRLPSHEKVSLSGIFKILLDKNEKCVEFHQWYNTK